MRSDARLTLRERTAEAHRQLDADFARFDLADRDDYRDFLLAHAHAAAPVEAAIAILGGWSGWAPRAPLLVADLADLDQAPPAVADFAPAFSCAEGWGAQYVMEGSKLGARVLLGRVGAGLPTRYLAATHRPGEWFRFQAELSDAADRGDAAWIDQAVAGALPTFALFAAALAGRPS